MAAKSPRKTAVSKVSARERARTAKARLDAQRADREKRVEDAATDFYTASDLRDEALAEIARREQEMAEAIDTLQTDGENFERIAELCGTTTSEVRRLRRLTSGSEAGDAGTAGEDSTGGKDSAGGHAQGEVAEAGEKLPTVDVVAEPGVPPTPELAAAV